MFLLSPPGSAEWRPSPDGAGVGGGTQSWAAGLRRRGRRWRRGLTLQPALALALAPMLLLLVALGLPLPASAGSGRLQEVAPPPAVQQLREALAERQPRVRILAPAAGSVLGDGPWQLKLQVDDWPLVDGGRLGLGPHLAVRIDDGEPLRLTAPEATLPALTPGSHRLTVYAARPWGEALKSPGAVAQIRLHRLAASPLTLPEAGSAQLLPVSPEGVVAAEPVLLDWLLIDAPLQHLRDDDTNWRLRVTVNGDSFLLDRQSPLWLTGWRRGSNAVQFDLLDGRGEPLNPPFNSFVRELRLEPGSPPPAWLGGALSERDRAILLGEAPAEPEPELEPEPGPEPEPEPEPLVLPEPEPQPQPQPEVMPEPRPERQLEPEAQPEPEPEPVAEAAPATEPEPEPQAAVEAPQPEPATGPLAPARGSARLEVNPDGTLKRPPRPGPLSGLRERLQR